MLERREKLKRLWYKLQQPKHVRELSQGRISRKLKVKLEEELSRTTQPIRTSAEQVTANKGAGGIDGMQTDELRDYLNTNWQTVRGDILSGNYKPQAVCKVEILKPAGGTRMLGIPTVTDRLWQQAIAQWLSPKYEEQFSNYSYGFREGCNAHQAVRQARTNLNEGYEWVIELDLENFFDKVNHDKLMGTLFTLQTVMMAYTKYYFIKLMVRNPFTLRHIIT